MTEMSIVDRLERLMHDLRLEYQEYIELREIRYEVERLQNENAELKSSLTHANEECLKWHERAQNLLKDSGGSISGYEKKISDLQAENAALRERLDRAIELPFFQKDGEVIVIIYKDKGGIVCVEKYFEDEYYDGKRGNDVAEARLAKLKG